jgi:hypothetical protein
LIQIIKLKDSPEDLIKLKEEIANLKLENQMIKDKISQAKIKNKFQLGKEQEVKNSNIFSCFSGNDEEKYTLNLNG